MDWGVPDDKPGNKRRENHTVYNERFAWWLGAYRYYLFLSFLPMLFYTTSRGNTTVNGLVFQEDSNARKKYSAKEKVRIVLEGLRGEERISMLRITQISKICQREGIHQNMYYKWSNRQNT